MIAYIVGVVLFALGVCLSLALHEFGHMATAKAFGMKVRRFFVGYGPTLFSFRRGGTEYGLKAVPLGGFCDIAGMTTLDEVSPAESPRAMWRFKTWQRTVVLATGPITHFVLAFLILYTMAATMGLPNTGGKPELGAVNSGAAQAAGIQPGDTITSVAGKPTANWADVVTTVRAQSGPTTVEVRRGGEIISFAVDIPKGVLGVSVATSLQYGPVDAVGATTAFTGQMFVQTWQKLVEFPQRVPALVSAIFGGERDPNSPVSVVGASRLGGEAVQAGLWSVFLLLLAGMNFFLGVFNLLPLLPLDGGHIAITWYERTRDWLRKLRGKAARGPVDYTRLATITMVLVVVGGALVALTITADLVNPVRLS